ncbi:LUD domain-containing protein, partial [Klebsiella pneumoniae]|uniref:LUD domain-containing protein n=1 Tax=Klebsiella pneumoniae TaxID=573 RepID=UPI003EE07FF8
PEEWTLGAGATIIVDNPALSIAQLDAVDSVITGCAVAIAETGTVVLDAGARQGRRALTLVPDHHVLVVREDQVVGGVHDAMGRIRPT